MGSSYFSAEGFMKAAFIRNMEVVDGQFKRLQIPNVTLWTKSPNCYDITSGHVDNWDGVLAQRDDNIASILTKCDDSIVDILAQRDINRKINKPFVKSIKSLDGDIIDCVLLHFQPAFDVPELKSTVSLNPPPEPSNGQSKVKMESELKQIWSSKGESCPNGTIPIRRTRKDDILRSVPISEFGKKFNTQINADSKNTGHEHAIGYVKGEYYGANVTLNVWAPNVTNQKEFSLSQIWVINEVPNQVINTIEAGWRVNPSVYGDNSPRLFIYWTDPNSKNWWLKVGSSLVGYWPATLFPYLREHATSIEFGGEVYNGETSGSHTSTQMGSGHFPDEGFGKASYIKNIEVVDEKNTLNEASNVNVYAEKPNCYDVTSGFIHDWGNYIYFGGPGNNPKCP
ncbi:hypothetical protein L6452_12920 [Arctium lappa]|uniref:Uncharacterized protein n=1 Tax=Arctium lappa TaxID=4217 RepID=A0ACB9CGR9_ARCLA|nr:hypothetical protein L6452_12920 [Arctium lappa]